MNTAFLAPEYAQKLWSRTTPRLTYSSKKDWPKKARAKLTTLLFGDSKRAVVDPKTKLVKLTDRSYHLSFWSESGALVTGRLMLPEIRDTTRVPLIICLQGHTLDSKKRSVGVTSLFGEGTAEDKKLFRERGIHMAEQAVQQGYAALAIEQRGFGERSDQRDRITQAFYGGRCHNPTMNSLLYGRTIIGDRVHDVSAAISVLESAVKKHPLPINMKRIACLGHSAGGTTAYYAAAVDERIQAVIASSSVCQFDKSISVIDHCVCNYVPNIRTWFEMGDVGCLIAPRVCIAVHGKKDPKFPISGVREAMKTLKTAYANKGVASKCALVEGAGGHDFFPEPAWRTLKKLTGW